LPERPASADLFELHLLPGDRLLARVSGPAPGPSWTWQILWHDATPPAQDRWCAAVDAPLPSSGAPLPSSGAPLRLVGDRLWWLAGPGQPTSLPLAGVRCEPSASGEPPRAEDSS
jgi:hypothetical protein